MANFTTKQDANQFPSLFALQGTAGTADVHGTAPLVRLGAHAPTGALYVYNLGPAGEVTLGDIQGGTLNSIESGTMDVNIISGTITAEQGDLTGGTIDLLQAGTITRLEGGTVNSVGTVPGIGTLTNVGSITNIGMLHGGTVEAALTMTDIPGGTIDLISSVAGGSIVVTAGTVDASLVMTDIPGGTIDLITSIGTVAGMGTLAAIGQVHNAGTLAAGNNNIGNVDVETLPNIPGGTLSLISALASGSIVVTAGTVETTITPTDIPGGTIDLITALGTVSGMGTLAAIGQVHNAGTIAALPNTPGGTLNLVTRVGNVGTLELGTVTVSSIAAGNNNIGDVDIASIPQISVGTIPQVSVGTIPQVSVGTIPNIPGGTLALVSALAAGSVAVTAGTVVVNPRPNTQTMLSSVTSGTAAIGTLVSAPGAATAIYVTGLSMKVGSGTLDLSLGFGTAITGTTVLERALISPTSGIVREFSVPNNAGQTNTALVYNINAGAGTAYWAVEYFVSA